MEKPCLHKLKSSGIKFVRVIWCDNANIIRGKAIHIGALANSMDCGVGISAAQQAIPVMYDAVIDESGLGPVGEVRLVPDWGSFTSLPYAPGHGRVMGDMKQNNKPWDYCPRNFLKKVVSQGENLGIEVKAAFENEFYLLRNSSEGIVPGDNTVFASTQSMDINQNLIDEISEALLFQGIPIEQYYPESGPGQQEISIGYTDPVSACDQQIAFRETVRAVAQKHGLIASFLPKIFLDKAGSGCHLHMSLWNKDINIVSDHEEPYGISKTCQSFIAGLLKHLPSLMSVTTPITNSYRRIRPHFWSGAFRCWGIDNREAAIRLITNPLGGPPIQFEFKTIDASSNPYLAMGSVITAGLDGVRNDIKPGKPVDVDPGFLTDEELGSLNIDPLPSDLGTAIEHLSNNKVLLDALGPKLSQAYLAVRRAEWKSMRNFELKEEVDLLLNKY